MSRLKSKLGSQLTIRPIVLVFCILALGAMYLSPAAAGNAEPEHNVRILMDDMNDTSHSGPGLLLSAY